MIQQETQHYPTKRIVQELQSHQLTWLEIDKQAFEHNIAQYKKIVHPTLLAIVVKSNAYGHGMHQIAALAEENSNVDYLCTASLSEAISLRQHAIKKPILVLSILDDTLEQAFIHSIDIVVYSLQQALELKKIGTRLQKKINVHIKIDTGLSRLGILHEVAVDFVKQLNTLSHLNIKGIFTHFAQSEKENQTFTDLQIERFNQIIESLEKEKIYIPLKHSSCSAAITANAKSHFTMARAGIGIYGLWSSSENKKLTEKTNSLFSLKPVLTWKTKIIQIKEVPAGSSVGYDRTYITKKISRIATLPLGYWDGYDRKLSNKGFVYINNHRAQIVGRIAMNLMMVDITNITTGVGDEVIVLGKYDLISADDLAKNCETINYEFVTRINPLLPRIIKY